MAGIALFFFNKILDWLKTLPCHGVWGTILGNFDGWHTEVPTVNLAIFSLRVLKNVLERFMV
jgi:hypothetical protein